MSTAATPVELVRVDKIVADYDSMSLSRDTVMARGVDLYIRMMGLDATRCDGSVRAIRESNAFEVFEPDVDDLFDYDQRVAEEMGRVKSALDTLLPKSRFDCLYGIITPYMQSVMVADDAVAVGLNHYLGAGYDGYASMPDYMKGIKDVKYMPRDVAEAVVKVGYPYRASEGTMLERMLYEGAVAVALERVGGWSPELTIGMTKDDYEAIDKKSTGLWSEMAANGLLYTTSVADIQKLVDPAPFARVGRLNLPGRVGRYLGYKIAGAYVAGHPDVTLAELLSPDFYSRSQQRLIESRYTPGK